MKLIQGHSKKCSNNILESFRLPGVKSFCAVEYLDKELSLQIFKIFELHQVSWKFSIKYAISTGKCIFVINFFTKRITIFLLYMYMCLSARSSFFSCIFSPLLWDAFLWMTLYRRNIKLHPKKTIAWNTYYLLQKFIYTFEMS